MLQKIINYFCSRDISKQIDKALSEANLHKNISYDALAALENDKYGVIILCDSGFKVKTPASENIYNWENIIKVVCYKKDLHIHDLICISYFFSGNLCPVEVHEQMKGFFLLCEAVKQRMPELQENYHKWLLSSGTFDHQIFTLWEK